MKKLSVFTAALLATLAANAAKIFVEAESFADKGGWVVDQQFMSVMGSPFLLAHGMGSPVADAKTDIEVKEAGDYRVLVRTREWAARWNKSHDAPGKFLLFVNGKPLPQVLGTKGNDWAWHEAGVAHLAKGTAALALHDLTGFDGRCDAIILTNEKDYTPPADVGELEKMRRATGAVSQAKEPVKADLVVAGGGVAGICTAISAARLGLKVALVHDRPVLGGNNSSEVRVHLGGWTNVGQYPRLGDVVDEIGPKAGGNAQPSARYEDKRKMDAVLAEKNISLFLSTSAIAVEGNGSKIAAIIGRNIETGVETRFVAPLFADCTGDGAVGFLAGAKYRYGREGKSETNEPQAPEKGDRMTMGSSVQWYSAETSDPSAFPETPWGLTFTDKSCQRVKAGEWTWETGMKLDQITEFERVRDYGMLVVYSNWSFLKNHSSVKNEWAKRRLDWVAYVSGKRESRRLVGDLILSENDIVEGMPHSDGTCATTWSIDLHYPDKANGKYFPGEEFKSRCVQKKIKPYPIPYRCLYSANVPNLFMAGRNISVTHVALGTVRVMRTTGMMGEVVGMAASICKQNNCLPRGVFEKHLDDLKNLMTKGVGTGIPQPPQNYNR